MAMWKKENVEPAEEDVQPVDEEEIKDVEGEVQEGVGVEEEEKEDGGAPEWLICIYLLMTLLLSVNFIINLCNYTIFH